VCMYITGECFIKCACISTICRIVCKKAHRILCKMFLGLLRTFDVRCEMSIKTMYRTYIVVLFIQGQEISICIPLSCSLQVIPLVVV
jgi:hypothetical protein